MDSLLKYLRNYFVRTCEEREINIVENIIAGLENDYKVGQYINIMGSYLNDGTYKIIDKLGDDYEVDGPLQDDTDTCYIFGLGIPNTLIDVNTSIQSLINTNSTYGGATSESQGGRSISYKDDNSWQSIFRNELAQYRRLTDDRLKCIGGKAWQDKC